MKNKIYKERLTYNNYWKKYALKKNFSQVYFVQFGGVIQMAKISEDLTNVFLKTDDIEGEVQVKVVGEHEEQTGDYGLSAVLPIELKEVKYNLRLNKTNLMKLIDKFKADDTSKWIGKTFKLSKVDVLVKGEKKKAFYVE